jgi:hypothetical protein
VKLLADEGVDAAIVAHLRVDGHDVVYVAAVSGASADSPSAVAETHTASGSDLLCSQAVRYTLGTTDDWWAS